MVARKRGLPRGASVEPWELELVRKVASVFRTHEREELEAELARKLLELKRSRPQDIRDWRRYVAKFLYNKAANWVRDTRARAHRHIPLVGSREDAAFEPLVTENDLPSLEPDVSLNLSLARIWAELEPELRTLWWILVEEGGNRVAAARRLGKHRNTIRLWIQMIRAVLKRHGFKEGD